MRKLRRIIRIDEEKCDGCGICAEACHEGAIRMVDGKARLVRESYCDGLGDCIGPCPRDAISFEEREAEVYDCEAVRRHLSGGCRGHCPGSEAAVIEEEPPAGTEPGAESLSRLSTWPVQIMLVPPAAPFLQGADLLIAADCVPFAYPDFHTDFLNGRVALVGCPKLDDAGHYLDKLTEMFSINDVRSVTVVRMEVPCCGALPRLVEEALRRSGNTAPLRSVTIGVRGNILEES